MNKNLKAFLDMIAFSEGTSKVPNSDDGYKVIVGGGLFHDYSDHPRKLIDLPRLKIKSTAAGRYQILARYYDVYKLQLGLHDFSPASQDAIAIKMIKECKALEDIESGDFESAVNKCRSRWASFPASGYRQHEHSMASLIAAYRKAGGELA
jgi:muramidase (phage lysozyme)